MYHRSRQLEDEAMPGVSDDERSRAIVELLDDEERRLPKRRGVGELDQLVSEAIPSIREHCVAEAWAGNWLHGRLGAAAYDAKNDLGFIQSVLNAHTPTMDTPYGESKADIRLWRVWADNAFDGYDQRWLDEKGCWHVPVEASPVALALERYRANTFIRQPYVTWALINAYILATGLEKRLWLEDECAFLLVHSGIEFRDKNGNAVRAATSGHLFYLHIMDKELHELAAVREMISSQIRFSTKEKVGTALLATSGFLHSLLAGITTIGATAVGYSLLRLARYRRIRGDGAEIERLLGKYGPVLRACRRAWRCANSSVVDLAELRVRIDDLAQEMGEDTSPIRWLVDDAADRWGATLNVCNYLDPTH